MENVTLEVCVHILLLKWESFSVHTFNLSTAQYDPICNLHICDVNPLCVHIVRIDVSVNYIWYTAVTFEMKNIFRFINLGFFSVLVDAFLRILNQ